MAKNPPTKFQASKQFDEFKVTIREYFYNYYYFIFIFNSTLEDLPSPSSLLQYLTLESVLLITMIEGILRRHTRNQSGNHPLMAMPVPYLCYHQSSLQRTRSTFEHQNQRVFEDKKPLGLFSSQIILDMIHPRKRALSDIPVHLKSVCRFIPPETLGMFLILLRDDHFNVP